MIKQFLFAINRGHDKVSEVDVEDALKRRSNYLVTYFDLSFVTSLAFSERVFCRHIERGELFQSMKWGI